MNNVVPIVVISEKKLYLQLTQALTSKCWGRLYSQYSGS